MKMSGTKPMKNTMRKKSPLKFANLAKTVGATVQKATGALTAKSAAKEAATVKTGGKSSTSGLKGLANKVREKVAEKQALKAKQPTQAAKPAPSAGGEPSNPNAPKPTPKTVAKTPTDAKSAAVKPTASASKGAPAASAVLQLKKHKR